MTIKKEDKQEREIEAKKDNLKDVILYSGAGKEFIKGKGKKLENKTGKTHISYTQLNLFAHCPRFYWLNYIDPKREKTSSKQQIFGSMQHDILCEINKLMKLQEDKTQLDLNDIQVIFDKQFKNYHLSLNDYTIAWNNIEHITLETIENRSQIYLAEEEFKVELVFKGKSIILLCRIDRVDKTADSIKIIDYKSSPLVPTAEQVLHDLQLNIYAVIVKKIFPDLPIFIERYSIGAGIGVKVQASEVIMAKVEGYIIELWQQMEKEKDFNPSDINEYCQYCPKVCKIYKQKIFEKYESKGIKDLKSAMNKYSTVRTNRLIMEKEEDSIYEYLKSKWDINQGQPLTEAKKILDFELRSRKSTKLIKEKVCVGCKALENKVSPYQLLVIRDNEPKEKKTRKD